MNPFVGLAIVVVIGYVILHTSGKKSEKKFWQEYSSEKDPPAHGWVDNQPSPSAWAWCALIAIIGGFIIAKTSGF